MGGGSVEVTQNALTPGDLNGLRATAQFWAQSIHLWPSLRRKDRRQAHINYVEAFPPKLLLKLFNHIQVLQAKADGWERAHRDEALRANLFRYKALELENEIAALKEQLAAVPTPDEEQVRKYIISKLKKKERLV